MPAFNTNPATCAYAEHETYHGLREQARLGRQREIEALLMTRAARRKTGNGSTHSLIRRLGRIRALTILSYKEVTASFSDRGM